ncbi:MAG TPA: SdpA family antimicrobial peptide system protein [Longimicrobium sp.]
MDPTSSWTLRWIKAGVWTAWGALIVVVLTSSAGVSPVKPRFAVRVLQLAVVPEGWSFFTRDPREPKDVAYRRVGGRLEPVTFANTSRASLMGASRYARAVDGELAGLLAPVLASTWRDCRGEACAAPAGEPLRLTNWSPTRRICGDVVVVRGAPVPWAWRRADVSLPAQTLHLRVDCGRRRPLRYR